MDELIRINFDSDYPTVSGRELHAALEVGTKYADWFKRMCDYGFEERMDYQTCFSNLGSEMHGGQNKMDHQLTIDMAKQLCMIQRTDIGRQFRQYFIKVEESWNSPEAVMARALQFANQQLELVKHKNMELVCTIAVQNQQITEMKPKASYYDVVLNCKDLVAISVIAKDYGWSANRMNRYLSENGVQYKQGKIWLLYQKYAEKGYTSTKTFSTPGSDGDLHNHVHTYWTQAGRLFIYGMLKAEGIVPLMEQEV
ncbi:MAG: phage antirepressor KilAC domain-containing protein [Lachnospiraceae bacterium]|nr:phage antirepressor KilAC domain-containing protein [Lachnospiraceae bacterium]